MQERAPRRLTRMFAVLIGMLCFGAGASILPACETVKGAGKDIQNVGQAGSDAIDSAAGKKK